MSLNQNYSGLPLILQPGQGQDAILLIFYQLAPEYLHRAPAKSVMLTIRLLWLIAWLEAGIPTASFLGEVDFERRCNGRTQSEKLQMMTSSSSKRCFPMKAGTLRFLEYFDLDANLGHF